MAHRLGAVVVAAGAAAARLAPAGRGGAGPWLRDGPRRRSSAWQAASGLGNVLLGWPLAAAVAHTAGAAGAGRRAHVLRRAQRARRRRGQPAPVAASAGRWLLRIDRMMSQTLVAGRTAQRRARPSKLRQYYALTKPRVVQLIVFCALIGMLLATPGLPDWRLALAAVAGIWLVAAAAAAFNCLVEQRIDSRMARTSWRATATGELSSGQALTLSAVLGDGGLPRPLVHGQPADDVADAGHLHRLRGRLHRPAQAAHAAEHRHRRRVGGDAAGARLGRDPRRRRGRGDDPLPDHLPLDAAALLGARALPRRRLRAGPACPCCR